MMKDGNCKEIKTRSGEKEGSGEGGRKKEGRGKGNKFFQFLLTIEIWLQAASSHLWPGATTLCGEGEQC